MIKSTKQRKSKYLLSVVFVVVLFALCSPFVFSLGYAPLTIHGHITFEGNPVIGAKVSMRVFENQSSSLSEETLTNENGDFIFVISIKESSPVDVQITTKTTETYVDVIEDALPWNTYSLDMRLENDTFAKVHVSSSARDTSEFDADMKRIISGELIDNPALVEEFKEKYGMEVVSLDEERRQAEEQRSSTLESPAFIPAPEPEPDKKRDVQRSFLEILAILVIVICIFLIRHETSHRNT